MSWMKRRPQPTPEALPQVQMYNPNQHSTHENQWQQQAQANWYNSQPQQQQQQDQQPVQQQNYWPPQPQQQQQPQYGTTLNQPTAYNQNIPPYGQYSPEQSYYNNTGYQQQPLQQQQQQQPQEPYRNMQYNQYNQNNMYGSVPPQPNPDADSWNWGWGDEDNSNIQTTNTPQQQQPIGNNIEEKFTNDESWNWSVDEKQQQKSEELFPKVAKIVKPNDNTDNNRLDHLTVSGKRGKLETPQWSVESQMSQESSDDILHTSESDKSHILSRSSTISHSPISGPDCLPPTTVSEEQISKSENEVSHNQVENKEIVSHLPPPTNTPPLLPPTVSSLDDPVNPYKRNFVTKPHKNFYANLETLPDNSEQPDQVPTSQNVPKFNNKPLQQWPENNEAPINDRNQYLETGQLSDATNSDFNQTNDNNRQDDALPPPGLRRMVLGQMEQNESQNNLPPPGLSRMVLGQTETTANQTASNLQLSDRQYDSIELPEGLHRMVPGESSSPESTIRLQRDENISETEYEQMVQPLPRSATIGADTPPTTIQQNPTISAQSQVNRSETIGGDNLTSQDGSRVGAIGLDNNQQQDQKNESRRDSIEGQTQDNDLTTITNSVRNLTVGENLTDGHTSNTSLPDTGVSGHNNRHNSRQETSDSEQEMRKVARNREKRSSERIKSRESETNRRDYSPDNYKDNKKYDRRRYQRSGRHYDDESDYYSDKDSSRRNRDDREYDKKYNSLRKEKDKDRKRREQPRDYGRRNDYYYGRYEDDYNDETNRSRPSSRSDSMHESFRERGGGGGGHDRDRRDRHDRDRERERYRYRRNRPDPRDIYNPYQGFAYDPYNPYYQQQYQYYKNLRRTNPQAYAEWYRKYYQQATSQTPSYGGEDRASVHSGRSSANDELAKERYTRQSYYSQASLPHLGDYYGDAHMHSLSGQYGLDNSSITSRPFDQTDASLNYDDSTIQAQRLTPAKFSTAHIKASIASGNLLKILPNYPIDGQNATVEIYNLSTLLTNDEEYKELHQFPGPLLLGVTHKKTIIEYCKNKIKFALNNTDIIDPDSYILMWELLILLIRQNGMVVGTDIAELLLKNKETIIRPSSAQSNISNNQTDTNLISDGGNLSASVGSLNSVLKEEEITNKFREYLLYGSGKEALEWAMKHGLWGHALFLASKLDKRTYANVMMRFANGLTLNDPLQTLYQLLSGKMPAAVTCVADEKWGDWRPHLAMILSNSTQRPELNCKAITSLGDTLFSRGSLYAAQFCYLMAQVGFSKHDNPNSKLVLLGSNHTKPFPQFATSEAIHMTEIYEYACSLNDSNFTIPEFQIYKYLLATRLADRGLLEKSLSYLEKLSTYIVHHPTTVDVKFVQSVYNLADKLKYYDPVGDVEDESEFGGMSETSRAENTWLKDLKGVLEDPNAGLVRQQTNENLGVSDYYGGGNEDIWQQQQQQQQQQFEQPAYQQNYGQWQQQEPQSIEYQQPQPQNDFNAVSYNDQSDQYYPNQQWSDQTNQYSQESIDQQQNNYGTIAQSENVLQQQQQPQISMPNQVKSKSVFDDDEALPHENKATKKDSPVKAKTQSLEAEKPASTGWFGGIFSKLAIKPKNQMKLPDDKNPKIVWDQEKKKWVNVDEDSNETGNDFKPPPKMTDLIPKGPAPGIQSVPTYSPDGMSNPMQFDAGKVPEQQQQQQQFTGAPDPIKSTQQNMFKLQRTKNIKKSYVDVFNPNGKPQDGPKPLNNSQSTSAPVPGPPQMNFFIPQPINDPNAPTDFLTPAPPLQFNEQQQAQ